MEVMLDMSFFDIFQTYLSFEISLMDVFLLQ